MTMKQDDSNFYKISSDGCSSILCQLCEVTDSICLLLSVQWSLVKNYDLTGQLKASALDFLTNFSEEL